MTLRPRDRIALGVVLVLAVIGGFYVLGLKPQQNKATSLDTQIASQRQALAQAQSAYATGKSAQASLKTTAGQWAAINRAVPVKSDIPALLRTLERNASAVHVKMTAIQLSDSATPGAAAAAPAPAPAPAGSTGTDGTAGTSPAGVTSVPLQLTFSGGYTALDKLVRRLDGLVVVSGKSVRATGPLLSISNVSLSGAPDLSVQLNANIYQLDSATSTTSAPTGGTS